MSMAIRILRPSLPPRISMPASPPRLSTCANSTHFAHRRLHHRLDSLLQADPTAARTLDELLSALLTGGPPAPGK